MSAARRPRVSLQFTWATQQQPPEAEGRGKPEGTG